MGMRKAINDKCKECNYDPLDKGNWRQQVQSCTYTDCSLYEYRPISKVDPRTNAKARGS